MKVYEIILEADPQKKDDSGISPLTVAGGVAGTAALGAGAGFAGKQIGTLQQKVRTRIRGNARAAKKAEIVAEKIYGANSIRILKFLGIVIPLYQLYAELDEIQTMFEKGEIDQATVKTYREFAWGVFITQIVTPRIIRGALKISGLVSIFRGIKNIVGAAAGGPTGGISVVAAIGSEAFFVWLQGFLGSAKGRDWLADKIGTYLKIGGSLPDYLWSNITDYYQKEGKSDQQGISLKAPKGSMTQAEKDAIARGEVPARAIDTSKVVYLNGVPVTDLNGKVIPSQLEVPAVKLYRDAQISRGKPDPLEVALKDISK